MSGIDRLKAFARSPHHAWLGMLTLGVGVATAQPLYAVIGAAAYALGWVFLPDTGLFRKWLARKQAVHADAAQERKDATFAEQRRKLYRALSHPLQASYDTLVGLASEIEGELRENPTASRLLPVDAQLHQLDALMWTYLRLLHTEETLKEHLTRERQEELPGRIAAMPEEIAALEDEIARLEGDGGKAALLETRRRLLESQRERLAMMERRLTRMEESQANLELAESEQRRIVGLVKMLAGELKTAQDAGSISRQIDSNASQLGQTNQWLKQIEDLDLDDLFPGDADTRVGYVLTRGERQPPPLPDAVTGAGRQGTLE